MAAIALLDLHAPGAAVPVPSNLEKNLRNDADFRQSSFVVCEIQPG